MAAYTPQTWHDEPATDTPTSAARFTHMEDGIVAAVPKTSAVTVDGGVPGYLMKFDHNYFDNGTGNEPLIFNGLRSATAKRAFWLNENCSPRAASINSEPALKLFGPALDLTYTGQVLQVLNRWDGAGSQQHLWGVGMDGNPRVGTGITTGSNVVALAAAATLPAGLPVGTVIVRSAGSTPLFRGFAATGISATSGNVALPAGSAAGDQVLVLGVGVDNANTVTLGSSLSSLYQANFGTGRAVIGVKQLNATDITNGYVSVTHVNTQNVRYGVVGYSNCSGFGTLGTPTIRGGSSTSITADGDSVTAATGQTVIVLRAEKSTSNPGPATVTPATTIRGSYYTNVTSAPSLWMGDYSGPAADRTFTDPVASANGMGVQIPLLNAAASNPSVSVWDGTTEISGGSGIPVFIANVTTPPATPFGGGVMYVEAGALKYKGSSGTVTVLGAA